MAFSDSSWKYCPDTVRSTGAYIIFHQGGPLDNGKHVPGPVAQSSAERIFPSQDVLFALISWYVVKTIYLL